jgi:hypothetical protein
VKGLGVLYQQQSFNKIHSSRSHKEASDEWL